MPLARQHGIYFAILSIWPATISLPTCLFLQRYDRFYFLSFISFVLASDMETLVHLIGFMSSALYSRLYSCVAFLKLQMYQEFQVFSFALIREVPTLPLLTLHIYCCYFIRANTSEAAVPEVPTFLFHTIHNLSYYIKGIMTHLNPLYILMVF